MSKSKARHFTTVRDSYKESFCLDGVVELIVRNESSITIRYGLDNTLLIPIAPGEREIHRFSSPIDINLKIEADTGTKLSETDLLISVAQVFK